MVVTEGQNVGEVLWVTAVIRGAPSGNPIWPQTGFICFSDRKAYSSEKLAGGFLGWLERWCGVSGLCGDQGRP